MKRIGFALAMIVSCTITVAADMNFSGARHIEINESPHVELSGFTGSNGYDDRRRDHRYKMNLAWQNKASKSIIAMESTLRATTLSTGTCQRGAGRSLGTTAPTGLH